MGDSMSASGYTPILLYKSGTTTNQPSVGNLAYGELGINYFDGKLFFKNASNVITLLASSSATGGTFSNVTITGGTISGLTAFSTTSGNPSFGGTGAMILPSGTTAQQPSPTLGMIRYNSQIAQFEGYSQVASVSGWYSVGGSSITNDTSASTAYYPLYAKATSGTAQVIYTANTSYTYKPSTGELTAPAPIASNGLVMNSSTVASSYTVASGNNAMSAGPITVNSGVTVTISSGSIWVIH
jgi:hypothetical protein